MGDEENGRTVAEQKALPVQHLVIEQGMGFSLPPAAEPMVVLSLADFNRLEPTVPVPISFLQELANRECEMVEVGEEHCDIRKSDRYRDCDSCSARKRAGRYLAISARERGPF